MSITPQQLDMAITISKLERGVICEKLGINIATLRRATTDGNVNYSTILELIKLLSEHVDFLRPGDIVSVPTVQPKLKGTAETHHGTDNL